MLQDKVYIAYNDEQSIIFLTINDALDYIDSTREGEEEFLIREIRIGVPFAFDEDDVLVEIQPEDRNE